MDLSKNKSPEAKGLSEAKSGGGGGNRINGFKSRMIKMTRD
jgi:hypothetical protein